jgi:DNA-binding NarL/FixJ family response regulator
MRILVADDHSLFRDGLVSLLEAAGHQVIGQVGDGEAAIEAAVRLRPELLLLDISMPKLDGLQALVRLTQESPGVKVVMLTVSDEEAALFEAMRAGAAGYLLKSLSSVEFLKRLEGLERGEPAVTPSTTARLMRRLASGGEPASPPTPSLTKRERELLGHVAHGMSNKAIAGRMSISENTVKYYMKNILQKLDAQNRAEAAAVALRRGWILRDELTDALPFRVD